MSKHCEGQKKKISIGHGWFALFVCHLTLRTFRLYYPVSSANLYIPIAPFTIDNAA